MGRASAIDFVETSKELGFPIEGALRWHLTANHYPPIHPDFFPAAQEAIEKANVEEWDHVIELPNGKLLTVANIVEQLHLEPFLATKEE